MRYLIFALGLFVHQIYAASYHSQYGQDEYTNDRFFKNRTNGVFVDIGAHDGVTFSNTYFFEKELGWKGICIEPMPDRFAQLELNRDCICIQGCISDLKGRSQLLMVSSPCVNTEMLSGLLHKYDPRHRQRVDLEIAMNGGSYQIIDVDCYTFNDLLEAAGITHVDLLSLDTEGGELDILLSIDFTRFQIDVITVEDNYRDPSFKAFLESKGYRFMERKCDDLIFIRDELLTRQANK